MASNKNSASPNHIIGTGDHHAMENFLVKKFGRTQTEEILREKLAQENGELKRELASLRPLPMQL